MHIARAEDHRERAAEIVALMLLTQFSLREAEADFSCIGAVVAAFCASQSPEELRRYSAMTWLQAVPAVKIAFAKQHLANQLDESLRQATTRNARRAAKSSKEQARQLKLIDGKLGKIVIAAFLKFISFRSVNPDWYGLYLEQMPPFEVLPS